MQFTVICTMQFVAKAELGSTSATVACNIAVKVALCLGLNKLYHVFFFLVAFFIDNRFLHLVRTTVYLMMQRTINLMQVHGETFNRMLAHGDVTHLL